jgi:hypothetical protein
VGDTLSRISFCVDPKALTALARVFVALLATAVVAGCHDAKDLGKVCKVFTELAAQPGLDKMDYDARMNFVSSRVSDELWSLSQVKSLWDNVPSFESTVRYRMFKRTAEDLLGHPWDCPDMQRLAPTLSRPIPESN